MQFPVIPERGVVVFDVETDGVDWRRNKPVGYVVTLGPDYKQSHYFPIRHADGGNVPEDEVLRWIGGWAKNPGLRIVGHNLKFDLHFAKNDGIEFAGPVECTMVNAALIDENAGKYGLEECARRAGVSAKRADEMYHHLASVFGGEATRKQMANFHKLAGDDAIAEGYARQDGVTTWQLWEWQQQQIAQQDLELVHGVECRVLNTLFRMERHGVRVDESKLEWLKVHLTKELRKAEKALPKEFNVRSTPQILSYVKGLGVSGWPLTEKQNPSFTEEFLVTFPEGRNIVAVRKISNLINAFVNPLIEEHLYQGRVHTNFNQLKQDEYGVATGRLSSSDPNLQQVPKRDKVLGRLFRAIFIPDPGFQWGTADYSQQEFRVFTEYTGAQMLMDGYMADPPIDIHTNVANMMGVERDPTAKRMNLGLLYGMGYKKLAASLGVSHEEARDLFDRYDSMLPEARKFLKAAEYWARQRGWVRTKLRRRRRFPNSEFAHKAGNSIIQGTSADITKVKMVEIDQFFTDESSGSRLLLQVHDELDWQVPVGDGEVSKKALSIMKAFEQTDTIHLKVPMGVDYRMGRSWAEATYGAEVKSGKQRGTVSKGVA